eukprot:3287962-Prymnesium_polylepis.1
MQWCCAMYVRCAERVPSYARLCRVHGAHLSELRVPDARLHACANVKRERGSERSELKLEAEWGWGPTVPETSRVMVNAIWSAVLIFAMWTFNIQCSAGFLTKSRRYGKPAARRCNCEL